MRETLCHVTSKPVSRWERVANCSCEKVKVSDINHTFMNLDKERSLDKSASLSIFKNILILCQSYLGKISGTLSIANRRHSKWRS
jgi:hypothetical protein